MIKPAFFIKTMLCGFVLFAFFSDALARHDTPAPDNCITLLETGSINWSTGKITASGKAAPLKDTPERSYESIHGEARTMANRNIIDILKQIKINQKVSVGAYASDNDIIMAGIEKTAMDATITRQLYTSNGSLEIIIETSMFGGFLQLVLPEEIRQIPQINTMETKEKKLKLDKIENYYTGLIIDARGLKFTPVVYPVIVSERGDEVYSSLLISREYAVQHGVCKYLCRLDEAMAHDRSGEKPLTVKALRTESKETAAIVVSMSDADTIEKLDERHEFLKQCKVVIVLDQ